MIYVYMYINKTKYIECFPYNGEDTTLFLKFKLNSIIIDHYIITEGEYSHKGVKKPLIFDINKFLDYRDKIIYLPLKNFPRIGADAKNMNDYWLNERYNRNEAYVKLKEIANDGDIIITTDVDEIVSPSAIIKFNTINKYASTQLYLSYYYYNQLSVFNNLLTNKEEYNFMYNAAKMLTFKTLQEKFNGDLSSVRGAGCNTDVASRFNNRPVVCNEQLIEKAGWHFTYVLNKADLIKKLTQVVEGTFGKTSMSDKEFYSKKSSIVAPNSYHKIVDINNNEIFPKELKEDVFQEFIKSSDVNSDLYQTTPQDIISNTDHQYLYDFYIASAGFLTGSLVMGVGAFVYIQYNHLIPSYSTVNLAETTVLENNFVA